MYSLCIDAGGSLVIKLIKRSGFMYRYTTCVDIPQKQYILMHRLGH